MAISAAHLMLCPRICSDNGPPERWCHLLQCCCNLARSVQVEANIPAQTEIGSAWLEPKWLRIKDSNLCDILGSFKVAQ